MAVQGYENDVVTQLIKYCHQNKSSAEDLFERIISHKERILTLPEGVVNLTEEEAGEFVARFSAEVEPTLWESKRRKH